METPQIKKKLVSGFLWECFERIGSQGLNFIFTLILARLLIPAEFGIIALLLAFINICAGFANGGFSVALIQGKDITEEDCSSVFFINIAVSLLLYLVLFLTAPLIANLYNAPRIVIYLRVLAVALIISAFSTVQLALLSKRMLFHLSCRCNWIALLVSGSVGVGLAYKGCGIWSLIVQHLCHASASAICLWLWVRWRPVKSFNWLRVKHLFRFGWKVLTAYILNLLYNDMYSFVIGKISDFSQISYYNRGRSFPYLGMSVFTSALGNVMLPAISAIQDDNAQIRLIARETLKNLMFVITPVLSLLFVLAAPIITVLLSEKWLPSTIFMRICCFEFLFWPLNTINTQIIMAKGRSDLILILEIIKKTQGIVFVVISLRFGVVPMVVAGALAGFLCVFENGLVTFKQIHYSPVRQILDMLPFLLISVFAGVFCYWTSGYFVSHWSKLILGGSVFAVLYIAGCFICRQIPAVFLKMARKSFPLLN